MSTAVIYQMPFNQQAQSRVRQRVEEKKEIVVKEVAIEDFDAILAQMDIRPQSKGILTRVQERFNAHLDEADAEDNAYLQQVLARHSDVNGGVVDLEAARKAKEEIEREKSLVASYSALRDFKRVAGPAELIQAMRDRRAYGGADGPDYQSSQEYILMQKFFAEELARVGLQHIQVV